MKVQWQVLDSLINSLVALLSQFLMVSRKKYTAWLRSFLLEIDAVS